MSTIGSGNYDLTQKQKEGLIEKQKRRMQLRAEFQKQVHNPFRHATGEGGALFDSGIQRFQALSVTYVEHFKQTPRSFSNFMFLFLVPMFAYGYFVKSDRDKKESQFRTGQVAYKDRKFQFV